MSLAFNLADRHVALGEGDSPAWLVDDEFHTFIELVEKSAALAGGLRRLGVGNSSKPVVLDVAPSWERVLGLAALLRLGLAPVTDGPVRLAGHPPVLLIEEEEIEWAQLIRIGQVDPVAAPDHDDCDLNRLLTDGDQFLISELVAGRAIDKL